MRPCRKCGGTERYACRNCKACTRARNAARDPAEERIRIAVWRDANREKIRARDRSRYAMNPSSAKAQARAWRIANPDSARKNRRAWFAANPDKQRAAVRKWNAANQDKLRGYVEKRRARRLAATVDPITAADLAAVLAANDGRCVYCNARAATEIDHVVPLSRGGAHALANLAGACRSCNRRKGNKLPVEWRA